MTLRRATLDDASTVGHIHVESWKVAYRGIMPDDVIAQIQRYQRETGCDHVHLAFGAGLPANKEAESTFGSFEDHASMIQLVGREVIPAFR